MSCSSSRGYSSSSEESCLEIVFPNGKTIDPTSPLTNPSTKNNFNELTGKGGISGRNPVKSSGSYAVDSDSSDSDEEEILRGGPTFSQKPAAKKRITTTETIDRSTHAKSSATEARRLTKLVRERQKRREMDAKAVRKAEEKAERQRQKEEEKISKKRRLEELQQAKGKFAHKEIAVLMDPDVYQDEVLNLAQFMSEDFTLHEFSSPMSRGGRSIQWVRKDFLAGGATEAIRRLRRSEHHHYEHLDRVVFILKPEDFIPLLQRSGHDVDDDYPVLKDWLERQISRWQSTWRTNNVPKLLLVLRGIPEALDKKYNQYKRQ